MKRQVVVMVSIALVSFLAGTLFSMGSTGLGILPNPFEEKEKPSPQIVKFQSPNEIFIPSEPINYTTTALRTFAVANFTWTPKDSLNNAVLSAYSWAEFKSLTDGKSLTVVRRLTINGVGSEFDSTYGTYYSVGNSYRLSPFQPWMSLWLTPSSTYTIQYQISIAYSEQVFIRNINVILVVVDGL